MMPCKRSLCIFLLLLFTACQPTGAEPASAVRGAVSQIESSTENAAIVQAFQAKKRDVQVSAAASSANCSKMTTKRAPPEISGHH